jgi:choline dehydrogenase-like flavoprotein
VLIDARTLGADEHVEADICIVGAGPAGIVVATELIGSGRRVCVLEAGGEERPRDAASQPAGRSVGYPYYPLESASVRAFGGSSLHWGSGDGDYWHACPFDEVDFDQRDGVPHSGWPFERSHLVPFYERAEQVCELAPFDYSPGGAHGDDPSRPLRHGSVFRTYLQVTPTTFTRHRARLDADPDTRVLLHANVTEIHSDAEGRVVEMMASSGPGRRLSVTATTFVMAVGGIETPRLFLLNDIGNEHGLVGRYFAEHIAMRSGAIAPSDGRLLADTTLYAHQEGGTLRPALRLAESVIRDEALLNVVFLPETRPAAFAADGVRSFSTLHWALGLQPRPRALLGHLGQVVRDGVDVTKTVRNQLRPAPGRDAILILRVQAEQSPNPLSRVTLGTRRDAFGVLEPNLDWQIAEIDRTSIRRAQDIVDRALRADGLGRLGDKLGDQRPEALILGQYHHLSTTRMHSDPRHGVVDADGRVHGRPNLYVTGGSVFPTVSWANPTLTVVALAIRLADHLRALATS